MKRNFFILLFFNLIFTIGSLYSQVGINTETPDPYSILDIQSTEKGVLFPRLTTTQRDNINPNNNANGLTIYNINTNCFDVWSADDQAWIQLCPQEIGKVQVSNCDQIEVTGAYDLQKSVSSQNVRIEAHVNVVKLGSYTYSASCNGLLFTAKGTFVNMGPTVVTFYMDIANSTPGNMPGTYTVALNISPMEGAVLSCPDLKIKFLERTTATLKILNAAGDVNSTGLTSSGGNDSSGSVYRRVGDWLKGGSISIDGTSPAKTAVGYAGTAAVQIVDVVPFNSTAVLKDELKETSIVWIGASQKYSYGFSQTIKEWFNAGKGVIIITGDKAEESTVADVIGYYIEDGSASDGVTKGSNLPEVFSVAQGAPYEIGDGLAIDKSGSNCGYVSSRQGKIFMTVNGYPSAMADIDNGIFILGDKFGETTSTSSTKWKNFAKVLVDIFAWSLKSAPIH